MTLHARADHHIESLSCASRSLAGIRAVARDCRTTKMRKRDARDETTANTERIRLWQIVCSRHVAKPRKCRENSIWKNYQNTNNINNLIRGGEGGDSNPRYGCPYAAFRVRCIQPLCHLSRDQGQRLESPWRGRSHNGGSRPKQARLGARRSSMALFLARAVPARPVGEPCVAQSRSDRQHAPAFDILHERDLAQALHHGIVVHQDRHVVIAE